MLALKIGLRSLALCFFALLALAAPAAGQATQAGIIGVVADQLMSLGTVSETITKMLYRLGSTAMTD